MAAIDKTYIRSFEEYDQVREWCKGRIVSEKPLVKASDFLYEYTQEDRDYIQQQEWYRKSPRIVLWNTPCYFDFYLAQNCPFQFIHDTLKNQYLESYTKLVDGSLYPGSDRSNWVIPKIKYNENDFGICDWFDIRLEERNGYYSYNTYTHEWMSLKDWNRDLFGHDAEFKGTPTKRKINRILSKMKVPKGVTICITGKSHYGYTWWYKEYKVK